MSAIFSNEQDRKDQSSTAKDENFVMKEFKAKQNLVGFFSLLLKIDKRLNPQNYQPKPVKND